MALSTAIPSNAPNGAPFDAIGVIVLGSLREAVLATAPLGLISAHHPSAKITVFTEPALKKFFLDCPLVGEVQTRWRPDGFVETLKARWAAVRSSFSVIYDLSHTPESEEMLRWFWPKKIYWSGNAKGATHPHVSRSRESAHPLDRFAEQLNLAGLGPEEGWAAGVSPLPNIDFYGAGEGEAWRQGIEGPFALLLPEGPKNAPVLAWPIERYGELALSLQRRGLRPVICGSPAAVAMGQKIRALCPASLDLVARLNIASFVALAREADLVVGGEGDLSTLAAAAGASLVALVNAQKRLVLQVAPRGPATVALVGRDFANINIQEIIAAAAAVARSPKIGT